MATANHMRRRRNAILTAIVMALIFIILIVIIVVGIANSGKKKGNDATKTPVATLPSIVKPSNTPGATFDLTGTPNPNATPDITGSSDPNVTPDTSAQPSAGSVMYVTGSTVNVRKEASTDSDKITALSKGTAVTAYNKVGSFYSVKLSDGQMGYISADYLSKDDPKKTDATPTAAPTSTPDTSKGVTKYVTGDKVNVRAAASASADKLTSLVKGKSVIAYTTSGDWTYIRYGEGKFGYISSKYLADSAPSDKTATPVPSATAAPTVTATPAPTEAPKKSFTDFGVPEAVAKIADAQTKYLNAATGEGGFGKVGETNYCIVTTDLEINGQKRFFVCYKGTDTEPTDVTIQSSMPTA